jgi:hypothetical protein
MLHPHHLKRPTSSSVNLKLGTSPLGHVRVSSASACAMSCDHSGPTPAIRTMPAQLRHTCTRETMRVGSQVLSAYFVLTRAHLGRTFRSVTHPKIALGQARLTSEFFWRWASGKEVTTYRYEYPINPVKP